MRSFALLLTCMTCACHSRRAQLARERLQDISRNERKTSHSSLIQEDPSQPLKALAKRLLAFNPAGTASPLQTRRQFRSSTPVMADDAAALAAQVAQLQAQVEILQKQKQIADLQAQLAALQQSQAATPPIMPPVAALQQAPSQLATPPVMPSPSQVAALQQAPLIQPSAPVMPSPAQVLQQVAPQSAEPPPVMADANQAAQAGSDAMTNVASAVAQAEKVVEEGIGSFWLYGEEALSAIFTRENEVKDVSKLVAATDSNPIEAIANAGIPDWAIVAFVGVVLAGLGFQQLSLGDLMGEDMNSLPNSAALMNSYRQRRSEFIRGRKDDTRGF